MFVYSRAYQIYEASKLAPFQYLEVAFSYLFDIFILDNQPDTFSIAGTILIVSVAFISKGDSHGHGGEEPQAQETPGELP